MPARYLPPDQADRLKLFGQRLERLMQGKGWSQSELARQASQYVPKTHKHKDGSQFEVGRHLVHAYVKGDNKPSLQILGYIAKALKVDPEELLPSDNNNGDISGPIAKVTATTDGKMRLLIDAEIDTKTALKIMELYDLAIKRGNKRS